MSYPLSLLVRSGRRFGAGPGHQFFVQEGLGRGLSVYFLVVLCTALMVSPALFAMFSLVVATPPWAESLKLMPILEGGRVLITLGLVTKVVRAREPE